MVPIVAGITAIVAGITTIAGVADGYGIIRAGHKPSQEHKAQYCSSAYQCRQGCNHYPAACNTS